MSEQSNWTPGPWHAGREDMATIVDGYDSKWIYAGNTYIAVSSGMQVGWDEVMANARLIAAAPELYEALYDLWYENQVPSAYHDRVTAALAKARGEGQ